MAWLDLKTSGVTTNAWDEAGIRHKIKLNGNKVMLHHQICEKALLKLGMAMDECLAAISKETATSTGSLMEIHFPLSPKL